MKERNVSRRKKRKGLLLLLIILLVLAAGILALWLWQKNNIDAVVKYTQYSQEELEDQLQENDLRFEQMLQDALDNAQKVDQEQSEEPEPPPEEEQEQAAAPQPQKPQAPTYQQLLQAIVDRAYALKAEYVGALEGMQNEATAEYRNIPVEQRTKKRLVDFASVYISRATNLEKECDEKMDQVVSDLEALQKQYGQSTELVKQVINTYANEKSLKKAWYMAELESRGMV